MPWVFAWDSGIFEMVSDRMLMQCADSPRAHIVTNYWNLATFTVFLQAEIVGMVGMEHDGKHKNALLRKQVAQILVRRDSHIWCTSMLQADPHDHLHFS